MERMKPLTSEEKKELQQSVATLKRIFGDRDVDIKEVIGLVSEDELTRTRKQIKIRLEEGTISGMNMIAFDKISPEKL